MTASSKREADEVSQYSPLENGDGALRTGFSASMIEESRPL